MLLEEENITVFYLLFLLITQWKRRRLNSSGSFPYLHFCMVVKQCPMLPYSLTLNLNNWNLIIFKWFYQHMKLLNKFSLFLIVMRIQDLPWPIYHTWPILEWFLQPRTIPFLKLVAHKSNLVKNFMSLLHINGFCGAISWSSLLSIAVFKQVTFVLIGVLNDLWVI